MPMRLILIAQKRFYGRLTAVRTLEAWGMEHGAGRWLHAPCPFFIDVTLDVTRQYN